MLPSYFTRRAVRVAFHDHRALLSSHLHPGHLLILLRPWARGLPETHHQMQVLHQYQVMLVWQNSKSKGDHRMFVSCVINEPPKSSEEAERLFACLNASVVQI